MLLPLYPSKPESYLVQHFSFDGESDKKLHGVLTPHASGLDFRSRSAPRCNWVAGCRFEVSGSARGIKREFYTCRRHLFPGTKQYIALVTWVLRTAQLRYLCCAQRCPFELYVIMGQLIRFWKEPKGQLLAKGSRCFFRKETVCMSEDPVVIFY